MDVFSCIYRKILVTDKGTQEKPVLTCYCENKNFSVRRTEFQTVYPDIENILICMTCKLRIPE